VSAPIAAIVGTGRNAPAHVMTNHDFAAIGIDTSHEWIVERSGIHERHIARDGETTCSMARPRPAGAGSAGVHAEEIDTIISAPRRPTGCSRPPPSTCRRAAARTAAAFDVIGRLLGLALRPVDRRGDDRDRRGGDDPRDRRREHERDHRLDRPLDLRALRRRRGRGRAPRPTTGAGILSSFMRSDGRLAELLYRPGSGATDSRLGEMLADRRTTCSMAGREVFKHAVRSMSEAADRALERRGSPATTSTS
jgi:3-oxoacyl-[acyl-carrier-protein] synthase-3